MRTIVQKQNLLWGIVLILFGVAAFVGEFLEFSEGVWALILLIAGAVSLAIFWQERANWAYLIPTYVFWVIAGLIAFISWNILQDEAIALYVLWGIGLPFLVAYLRNRIRWGLLIPAYVLFAVGFMVFLIGIDILDDLLISAYVMLAIAMPFFVVYWRNPKNWWALIPAGIMSLIAAGFLLASPAVRFIVPVAMILVGIWFLWRQFRKGKAGSTG